MVDNNHPMPTSKEAPPKRSAAELMQAHKKKHEWKLLGSSNIVSRSHESHCTLCNEYIQHLVDANERREIKLSHKDIATALCNAWPSMVTRLESNAVCEDNSAYCHQYKDLEQEFHKMKSNYNEMCNYMYKISTYSTSSASSMPAVSATWVSTETSSSVIDLFNDTSSGKNNEYVMPKEGSTKHVAPASGATPMPLKKRVVTNRPVSETGKYPCPLGQSSNTWCNPSVKGAPPLHLVGTK